jgi:hypothetical protein
MRNEKGLLSIRTNQKSWAVGGMKQYKVEKLKVGGWRQMKKGMPTGVSNLSSSGTRHSSFDLGLFTFMERIA